MVFTGKSKLRPKKPLKNGKGMKILFLTNHLKGDDGLSKVSLDFAQTLQRLGHDILCLTHESSDQNEIKEIPVLGDLLKYLINPQVSFLTAVKLRKTIKEFSPDVIHFMEGSYASILPFLNTRGAKTFITVHGTYSVIPLLFKNFFKKTIADYLSRRFYRRIDGVVAVSNYTKNHLLKHYPWLEPKVRVIANGINLEKSNPISLSEKPQNKIKKILFVGAIKERKGILEAIEACRHYRENFSPDFVYDLVGGYDKSEYYYQRLIKKIKECDFEDKVIFRGRLADKELYDYYRNANLFLMTPLNINHNFEGFGLVFLEANARGVPCIGSENSGCQEAIVNGKTGYVINPLNPEEIAQKMDLVLGKNAIRPEDCILWAKQNDIKIKARELVNFYQSENTIRLS